MNLAIWGLGAPELVIILVIVLVLFGAGRIKNIMKEMGSGISSFKKGMKDGDEESKMESRSGEEEKKN